MRRQQTLIESEHDKNFKEMLKLEDEPKDKIRNSIQTVSMPIIQSPLKKGKTLKIFNSKDIPSDLNGNYLNNLKKHFQGDKNTKSIKAKLTNKILEEIKDDREIAEEYKKQNNNFTKFQQMMKSKVNRNFQKHSTNLPSSSQSILNSMISLNTQTNTSKDKTHRKLSDVSNLSLESNEKFSRIKNLKSFRSTKRVGDETFTIQEKTSDSKEIKDSSDSSSLKDNLTQNIKKCFLRMNTFNKLKTNPEIMNIVNNVNPTKKDKNIEINFNQFEINIHQDNSIDLNQENKVPRRENKKSSILRQDTFQINKSNAKKITFNIPEGNENIEIETINTNNEEMNKSNESTHRIRKISEDLKKNTFNKPMKDKFFLQLSKISELSNILTKECDSITNSVEDVSPLKLDKAKLKRTLSNISRGISELESIASIKKSENDDFQEISGKSGGEIDLIEEKDENDHNRTLDNINIEHSPHATSSLETDHLKEESVSLNKQHSSKFKTQESLTEILLKTPLIKSNKDLLGIKTFSSYTNTRLNTTGNELINRPVDKVKLNDKISSFIEEKVNTKKSVLFCNSFEFSIEKVKLAMHSDLKQKNIKKIYKNLRNGIAGMFLTNLNKETEEVLEPKIILNKGISVLVTLEHSQMLIKKYMDDFAFEKVIDNNVMANDIQSNAKITLKKNFKIRGVQFKSKTNFARRKTLKKHSKKLRKKEKMFSVMNLNSIQIFSKPNFFTVSNDTKELFQKEDKNYEINAMNMVHYSKYMQLDFNHEPIETIFSPKNDNLDIKNEKNMTKPKYMASKTQEFKRRSCFNFLTTVKKDADLYDEVDSPKETIDKQDNNTTPPIPRVSFGRRKTKQFEEEAQKRIASANFSLLTNTKFFEINKKYSIFQENVEKLQYQKLLSKRRFDYYSPRKGMSSTRLNNEEINSLRGGKSLNKESMMFRTHEIKSKLLDRLKNPTQSLFFYIKDDNYPKFKEVIEKHKTLLEVRDEDGNTLLNVATQCNSWSIVNFLVNLGANVNTKNNQRNTPLHYAFSHKNFKIADVFIRRKAKEDIKNIEGLTAWQCLTNCQLIV